MLAGALAILIVAFQCIAAHELRPIYDMSKIGLWFEKGTGAFLVGQKNTEIDTVSLFGFDGTVKSSSECADAVEVDFSVALYADNLEAILSMLKPHFGNMNWLSFLPTVLLIDPSSFKLLPSEFWSSIGPINCISVLTRLPSRSSIIDHIYHLERIGVNTDLFCVKAAESGKAHGPSGGTRREPKQVLFLIRQPNLLLSNMVEEPLYLHTKLFDDQELVQKDQPIYLYHTYSDQ